MFEGFFRRQEEGVGSDVAVAPKKKHTVQVQRHVEPTPDASQGLEDDRQTSAEGKAERRAEYLQKIHNTIFPEKVVIVGASTDQEKPGYWITRKVGMTFPNDTIGANPSHQGNFTFPSEQDGSTYDVPCVNDFEEIRRAVDSGEIDPETTTFCISIAAANALDLLEKYAGTYIRHVVVISNNFKEAHKAEDDEAQRNQNRLDKLVQERGIIVNGPNCAGFMSVSERGVLDASFLSREAPPLRRGGVSFASDSGGNALDMIYRFLDSSVGVRSIISTGNATIPMGDMLEMLKNDNETKTVTCYAEDLSANDIEIISRITREKPVLVLMPGKSEAAEEAARHHTGKAAGGKGKVMRAALEQAGAVVFDDIDEFADAVYLAEKLGPLREVHGKTAVVGNSGGTCVLYAGETGKRSDVTLPAVTQEEQKKLKAHYPSSGTTNPIDVVGTAKTAQYIPALESVANMSEYGTIVCVELTAALTPAEEIAQELIRMKEEFEAKGDDKKIIVIINNSDSRAVEARKLLLAANIPVFDSPNRACRAQDYVLKASKKMYEREVAEYTPDEAVRSKTEEIIQGALRDRVVLDGVEYPRKALYAAETADLLAAYGLTMAPTQTVREGESYAFSPELDTSEEDALEAALYVAKIDPPITDATQHYLHKAGGANDAKAVYLRLTRERVEKAIARLRESFPGMNIMVQKQMDASGGELLIGAMRDEMGITVLLGKGGAYAEGETEAGQMALKFSSTSRVDRRLIREHVESSKYNYLFTGKRGNPKLIDAITDHLYAVFRMMSDHPEIKAFDGNPACVDRFQGTLTLVDGKVMLSDVAPKAA